MGMKGIGWFLPIDKKIPEMGIGWGRHRASFEWTAEGKGLLELAEQVRGELRLLLFFFFLFLIFFRHFHRGLEVTDAFAHPLAQRGKLTRAED
jgi:hypothetical protein